MTEMTAMPSTSPEVRAGSIDMSLRFWSDTVPLQQLLAGLSMQPGIFHVRGAPIARGGRIARRHFASIAISKSSRWADVEAWIASLTRQIKRDGKIVDRLQAGDIEATFWIAVLGEVPDGISDLPERTVNDVAQLGATIFIEDYTRRTSGNSAKKWLAAEPVERARAAKIPPSAD